MSRLSESEKLFIRWRAGVIKLKLELETNRELLRDPRASWIPQVIRKLERELGG